MSSALLFVLLNTRIVHTMKQGVYSGQHPVVKERQHLSCHGSHEHSLFLHINSRLLGSRVLAAFVAELSVSDTLHHGPRKPVCVVSIVSISGDAMLAHSEAHAQ